MRFLAVFFVLAFVVPLTVMWLRGRALNQDMPLRSDRPGLDDSDRPFNRDAGGGWGV